MSVQALEHREDFLTTHFKARSAEVAMNRNGFLESGGNATFLLPRITIIRDWMQKITDDPARHKHFPWHDFIRDLYGPKYTQEVGLKVSAPDDSENKFTFHYSYGMIPAGNTSREYNDFLGALRDLDQWALRMSLAMAACYDTANRRRNGKPKYPGSLVEKLKRGTRVIRVLRYRKKEDDLPDAKPHVDRSVFTVHAWSSHSGLKMVSPDGSLWPVQETSLDTVAMFPGEKFAALTRGNFGFGTPHGVRDERRKNGARDEDRFAVVCFVHPEPLQEDAEWLLSHRDHIEAQEATIQL